MKEALKEAAKNGDLKEVQTALDVLNKDLATIKSEALFLAVLNGNENIVDVLIQEGAFI